MDSKHDSFVISVSSVVAEAISYAMEGKLNIDKPITQLIDKRFTGTFIILEGLKNLNRFNNIDAYFQISMLDVNTKYPIDILEISRNGNDIWMIVDGITLPVIHQAVLIMEQNTINKMVEFAIYKEPYLSNILKESRGGGNGIRTARK